MSGDPTLELVLHAVIGARIVGDKVVALLGASDATLRALGQARRDLVDRFGRTLVEDAERILDARRKEARR